MGTCLSEIGPDGAVAVILATFAGLVILTAWIARQDRFFGKWFFVACTTAMSAWLVSVAAEMSVASLPCKLAFAYIAWPAIAAVPVAFAFFVRNYCFGGTAGGRRREWAVLALIVAAVTTAVATNRAHGLFYGPETRLETIDGRPSGVFDHGPLFYAAAGTLYLFMAFAVAIALSCAFRAPRPHRPHFIALFVAALAPLGVNVAYVGFGLTLFGFDPTPFAFAFVLIVAAVLVFDSRMFDLSTIARDLIYFSMANPVVVVNGRGLVAGANPAARDLFGTARIGGPVEEWPQLAAPVADVLGGAGERRAEGAVALDGRIFDLAVLPIHPPVDGAGTAMGAVVLLTDTTELRTRAARLEDALMAAEAYAQEVDGLRAAAERNALLDPLTGLENRRAFLLHFEAVSRERSASEGGFTVALIDLDHFKAINDSLGHAAGDRVLILFARDLAASVAPQGAAFRIGGEEFLAIFPGRAPDAAAAVLEDLRTRIDDSPYLRHGDGLAVTFSAGIARYPGDGTDFETLYHAADARLYAAKRLGRDRTVAVDAEPRRAAGTG